MKLSERIRAYRLKHGITQTFIAGKVGMSVKTLNGIELGRQRLDADLFEKICRQGFGIDPSIFFREDVLESKNKYTGTEGH